MEEVAAVVSVYIIDIRRPGPRGPFERQIQLPAKWHTIQAENDEEALDYVSRLTRFGRHLVRTGDFVIFHIVEGDPMNPPVYERGSFLTEDGEIIRWRHYES